MDVWAKLYLQGSELDGKIQALEGERERGNVKAKQCHFFSRLLLDFLTELIFWSAYLFSFCETKLSKIRELNGI